MHQAIREAAEPGVTTARLDQVARDVLARREATSNFLGYHGFPAVICASVNDELIHGIPHCRRRWPTVTCCRSTAVRSSTAGTPTRRSRCTSARWTATITGSSTWPSRRSWPGWRRCTQAVTWATSAPPSTPSSPTRVPGRSPHDYCGHGIGRAMHEEPDVPNRGQRQGPSSWSAACWRSARC
ncbi:MAG: M24 family metallopeptidase [Ilumatobacteraceae bacterium]